MTDKWDPRGAKPASRDGYMPWLRNDLSAFQREHPELPQDDVGRLPNRKFNQILKAWNRAREAAELEDAEKVSPEYAAIVDRFHRARILSTTPGRRRKKSIQFYVVDEASAFRAMDAAMSGTVITISGITDDKAQDFAGVVKSVRKESAHKQRWLITIREAK
jgi:hypothetical protein